MPVDEPCVFLYNTLSREKELFVPGNTPVRLYTCGPTVYNFAHIGNFRTYVFEDLLKRTLLFFDYSVHHVMNITDVDDKTITGACKQKISLEEYTQPYTQAFFEDLAQLHILPADAYPHATHYIPQMIEAISALIEKGIAYQGQDGSVYFSIKKFPGYGKLSHLCLEELQSCSRVACDEYDKDHLSDFVLWKAYEEERDGNIYWESPFGKGRPGWHLECSIMSMHLLGESIDIHAGGVDNIFPHHENEIAQSESLSHKPFVRYWLHSEHLLVNGKKMSKSLGNFFTLRDLLAQGFSGKEVRYLLLQSHYRMQLNFTEEGLRASRQTLKRLNDFIARLELPYPEGKEHSTEVIDTGKSFLEKFKQGLANDLNVSASLAALFDFVRDMHNLIDTISFSALDALHTLHIMQKVDSVLGVLSFAEEQKIPDHIQRLAEEREEARQQKNWEKADALRKEVASLGFCIEDSKSGPVIKKID